ncbi:MAG: DUF1080 domain-containing protein, partial [Prevotellaceae bacterium]|nr:DUF1080 domain-containing protein [Prevotellaceae bacterium]
ARVLTRINSENAGAALLNALKQAKPEQKIVLIQALGDIAYTKAVADITPAISDSDPRLKKTALYALSKIAAPESEKALYEAVTAVNYLHEPSEALGAYIAYLQNRLLQKDVKQVIAASKKLLKATSEDKQIAAKTAALALYVASERENKEDKAVAEVLNALKSNNKQYRLAALDFSMSLQRSPKMYKSLTDIVKKEKNAERRAEAIYALGIRGVTEIKHVGHTTTQNPLRDIESSLQDADNAVKTAAIEATGRICSELPESMNGAYIPKIIAAMNTDNREVVAAGENALRIIKNEKLVAEIAAAIPASSNQAKIALLNILASRKAYGQFDEVYAQATSSDENVRVAACKALRNVSQEKNAPLIAALLNTADNKAQINILQDALYSSVSSLTQKEQYQRVFGLLKTGRKPAVYYNVFAKIGGSDALKFVLQNIDGQDADAAFEALTNWSDASVSPALLNIAKTKPQYFDRAFAGYVSKINVSNNKPEQKLLLLRNALDIAVTSAQKQNIIKQIAQTKTFQGLLVAGKYLDDSDNGVQQAAVQAVRTIALSNRSYYGNTVKELLHKAIAVNKNTEADYQKQEILKHLSSLPKDEGFVSMFNGKDLTGWKGLVENPIKRGKMKTKELAEKQKKADENMYRDWHVENGLLVFDGKGYDNLCSVKQYGDFEMYVDWKIAPEGDAGLYLRGTPQVQIWDTSRVSVGAQVGSGGLYNNQKHQSKPLLVADNPVNEWNSFYIRMVGEKVTVYLNGHLVTDNVVLENYWDRSIPIFPKEQIELQAHGTRVEYRDIYIREIPRPEPYELPAEEKAAGFVPLFNGIDMSGWTGNLTDYVPVNGTIICDPSNRGHGNLYTEKEYSNFIMRFEFKLTPAANNGLGIRTPLQGDAAYVGMELQILDNEADVYKNLAVYQYHGSVYGVIAAKRGYLKPTGEWNVQEVIADGNKIKVTLNGTVILDGDIAKASKNFTATADKHNHPGLSNKSGHIGFLGHGSYLEFRNLRIKELKK